MVAIPFYPEMLMSKLDGNKPEKQYSKPTLTVYGKISELTTSVGKNNASDAGKSSSMVKTAI